jgi:hypothetical protein
MCRLTRRMTLTDPGESEVFVRETGCDRLAVAIGTRHGATSSADTRSASGSGGRIQQPTWVSLVSTVHRRFHNRMLTDLLPRTQKGAKGVDENEFAKAEPLGDTQVTSTRTGGWFEHVCIESSSATIRIIRFARSRHNLVAENAGFILTRTISSSRPVRLTWCGSSSVDRQQRERALAECTWKAVPAVRGVDTCNFSPADKRRVGLPHRPRESPAVTLG